jgi:hypothetical protein
VIEKMTNPEASRGFGVFQDRILRRVLAEKPVSINRSVSCGSSHLVDWG